LLVLLAVVVLLCVLCWFSSLRRRRSRYAAARSWRWRCATRCECAEEALAWEPQRPSSCWKHAAVWTRDFDADTIRLLLNSGKVRDACCSKLCNVHKRFVACWDLAKMFHVVWRAHIAELHMITSQHFHIYGPTISTCELEVELRIVLPNRYIVHHIRLLESNPACEL
jgi:hypothetical protein